MSQNRSNGVHLTTTANGHTVKNGKHGLNGVAVAEQHHQSGDHEDEPLLKLPNGLINEKLPKELLLVVFSYLDVTTLCRCAQVCRLWNVLALDGSNWQEVDLFNFQKDVNSEVVERLAARCGVFLKSLTLSGCVGVTCDALTQFSELCNNIESLILEDVQCVLDETIEDVTRNCKKLKHLNLSSCVRITNHALTSIGTHCTRLEYLNVSWSQCVTDCGVVKVANGCHKLKQLVCRGCRIGDTTLIALSSNCPDLETIDVLNCTRITDAGVASLSKLEHLTYVSLTHCSHITDNSLLALAQCSNLKCLEVAHCSLLSDHGFSALLTANPDMRRLDLEDCLEISDRTVITLAQSRELQSLILSHCERVTDDATRAIAQANPPTLSYLALDNLPMITDATLQSLAEVPSLRKLDLYDCPQISRSSIRTLTSQRPQLNIQAYFAPHTPPRPAAPDTRRRYCRCCVIL